MPIFRRRRDAPTTEPEPRDLKEIGGLLRRLERCEEGKWTSAGYEAERAAARKDFSRLTLELGSLAVGPLLEFVETYIDILKERYGGRKEPDGKSVYGWAKDGVAVIALGELSAAEDDRVVEPSLRLAELDPPPDVAAALITLLVPFRELDVCWSLVRRNSRHSQVREAAEPALVALGDAAVESCVKSLQDEEMIVRLVAAEVLGQIKALRAVGPLGRALRDPFHHGLGPHYPVRDAAAKALENIGGPEAERALANYRARGRDVETLLGDLKDERDSTLRREAAQTLGRLGDRRAVDPLITALKDEDPGARMWATEALGNLRDARAVEPLISALKDEASNVRLEAAKALGKLGDARAVEPLIVAFEDEDSHPTDAIDRWSYRATLARTLGELGDARAVDSLASALRRDDGSEMERRDIESALEKMGRPEVALLESLIGAGWKRLDDQNRRDLSHRIGEFLDTTHDQRPRTELVDRLVEGLQHEAPQVRINAAKLLGRSRDPRAIPHLAVLLTDKSGGVREAATKAVKGIGGPDAERALAEYRAGET